MPDLRSLWAAAFTLLFAIAPTLARAEDEEEAVRVYKQVKPSVVSLQNAEGSGTGILINADGLILTNAHVVTSPLPFKVKVDAGKDADVTFAKVQIVGYHPRLDLALVKVDPKEQHVTLVPAALGTRKAEPGQRIFVIGNPGAGGMILTRTITSGMISGVDRVVEGEKYYQTDAAINPGNSGGPVCDRAGKVLGLVTFKFNDAQATGFAIPLYDVDLKGFVPITGRRADPEKAAALVKLAEQYASMADRIGRSGGMDSDERKLLNAYAAMCYRLALVHDPANPAIFYNVGMLLRTIDENEAAAGYLARAVQLEPWDKSNGNPYRELGLALAQRKQDAQALLAWREGLAKSPYAAKIWEDLAVYHVNHRDHAQAAVEAATALLIAEAGSRIPVLEKLLAEARQNLSGAAAKSAEQQTSPKAIVAALDKLLADSNAARRQRKPYVTAPFAALIETIGGTPIPGIEKTIATDPQPRLKALARYSENAAAPGGGGAGGGGWAGSDAATGKAVQPKGTRTPGADDGGWVGGGALAAGKGAKPQLTGQSLAVSHHLVADAAVTPINSDHVVDIAFSADGAFAFLLQKDGVLRKMAVADQTEQRRIEIGSPCAALARGKPGLAVAVSGAQEVWVLNENLELQRRITVPATRYLVASPASPVAYASAGEDSIYLVDLAAGTVRENKGRDFEAEQRGADQRGPHGLRVSVAFWHIAITPDGHYLLVEGNNTNLMRFRIGANGTLAFDGASPLQADNISRIDVSGDSRYVAVPAGGGNMIEGMPRTVYATYVFAVGDITKPATVIDSGAYPQALGFDAAARCFYAQHAEMALMVFSGAGLKGKQYAVTDRPQDVHRFVVHPAGHRLFVMAERVYWVELP